MLLLEIINDDQTVQSAHIIHPDDMHTADLLVLYFKFRIHTLE